ncbi:amphi-Trp domain-containing protein [Halalkalicoccus subterraneus]|uniref:amphi-Trp domain-containing protein n=1 Tax=Halalkalicoccus subterraneus TaxID=2675002 RepID=UPI000EFB8B3E|nr:amphi-Trp domain-containing protein [Halalkalicoccus subterraneus]
MAETTSHDEELSRKEAAAFLRSVADELDSGQEVIEVPIGNKGVRLSPSDVIDTEATVTERSRRLRKDIEELSIEFTWNPTAATVESEAEAETEVGDETTESDAGPRTDPESETGR